MPDEVDSQPHYSRSEYVKSSNQSFAEEGNKSFQSTGDYERRKLKPKAFSSRVGYEKARSHSKGSFNMSGDAIDENILQDKD